MVNIFLNGCCGRMGHTIAKMCQHNDEYRVVAGCDVTTCDEYNFPVYSNPQDCAEDFDVIIDFSNAKAVPTILNYALSKNKPFICCTTALSDETVAELLKASETIPVFKSANMSVGINLMLELVKKCTKTLYPEYDIEIVEAHHNRKLDAPSGTAMMIANAISQEIPEEVDYVYDRQSKNEARKKNEIGISSIRGGNIVGDHSAMFINDEEILTVSHRAMTRDVFAKGALTAAGFMCGKQAGYYNMSDVIAEAIKE
ncbi:MAG: 4-hydroxy-tetrahydrodipicolinate reductase [Clostridiales bacterium]|nr:4-hydroxy-tetrahydrodipicolinate reductase [Clostridiales bacterium]